MMSLSAKNDIVNIVMFTCQSLYDYKTFEFLLFLSKLNISNF